MKIVDGKLVEKYNKKYGAIFNNHEIHEFEEKYI